MDTQPFSDEEKVCKLVQIRGMDARRSYQATGDCFHYPRRISLSLARRAYTNIPSSIALRPRRSNPGQ